MSEARFDRADGARNAARRALTYLIQAQEIIDSLSRPEIGARLEELIDAVRDLSDSVEDEASPT